MAAPRYRTISTKVTDDEYAQIEALAGPRTISEWVRENLLKAATPDPLGRALLAEVVALRTILLNLHFAIANGRELTEEWMQTLIDRADQEKWRTVQARLVAALTAGVQ